MSKQQEVELLLKELQNKVTIFGIVFIDERQKNAKTILILGISPNKRIEIIKRLNAEDYSEGPIEDKISGYGQMWVFGKLVRKREIYIKICMGLFNNSAVCISFHIAERSMKYPLKK